MDFFFYVNKKDKELIFELNNYAWDKDKDGNTVKDAKGNDVPIKKYDDTIDAIRYAETEIIVQRKSHTGAVTL